MSKAFVKDDIDNNQVDFEPVDLIDESAKFYLTPAGIARLHADLADLVKSAETTADPTADKARRRRINYLEQLIKKSEVIDPALQSGDQARFGATVTVKDEDDHLRTYQIVGVYEADTKAGKVSYLSPIAKALLGSRTGDIVTIEMPQTEEELEVVSVKYH